MTQSTSKKRRRFSYVAVLIAVILMGCLWQSIMERINDNRYPAPGNYVSTEAYNLHYVTKGDGEIAIVFIGGSGTPCAYTDFYNLQERLSSFGQTISFDHAGSGWSSSADKPRTVENLAAEMTELLATAAPGKQVVLVCHSLGSLEAIYFTQHNPEKVLGIVFLDSGAPEFYRVDSELTAKGMNRGIALTRTIGLTRLLCCMGIPMPVYGESNRMECLSQEINAIDKAMLCKHAGSKENLKVIDEMNENAETVESGSRLRKLPILVLSSESGQAWNIVQKSLAGWSENSRQITLKNSKHYLHWSNPHEVEEEIIRFIGEIVK